MGINVKTKNVWYDDGLCGINISNWYVIYTTSVACKLLLTFARYYYFKKNRKENIPLFFTDLIGMNLLMSGIFI